MFKKMFGVVKADFASVVSRKKTLLGLFIAGIMAVASSARAEVILPTTLDVSEYITVGIAGMAAVVATAMGGYVAFLLVRKAMRWIGRAMG